MDVKESQKINRNQTSHTHNQRKSNLAFLKQIQLVVDVFCIRWKKQNKDSHQRCRCRRRIPRIFLGKRLQIHLHLCHTTFLRSIFLTRDDVTGILMWCVQWFLVLLAAKEYWSNKMWNIILCYKLGSGFLSLPLL